MKNISAARAEIVTMNVVLRTSLLRACVDSTTPTDTPVSRIAKGTANDSVNLCQHLQFN